MPVLLVTIESAILIGCIAAWIWIVSRYWQQRFVLPMEPRRLVPWRGIDLLVILASLILLQGLCLGIGVKWAGLQLPGDWNDLDPQGRLVLLAANLVANVLMLIAAVAILTLQSGARAGDLGFQWRRVPYDLCCGVIAFLAAAPIVFGLQWLVTQWVPYQHKLIDAVQDKNDVALSIVAGLSAIVVAPLFEEFFFRVLLQGWLEKKELTLAAPGVELSDEVMPSLEGAGPSHAPLGLFGLTAGWLPIVITSTIFALMHWGQGGAPLPLFVFALVLGYLYQRTHRILPSLTVHILLNSVSLVMLFAAPKI